VDWRERHLDPLSPSEAEELAARLLGCPEARDGWPAAIAHASGGNPLFVSELVRYLHAENGRSLGEGAIDLVEVQWQRIKQLPAPARRLLALVALAARPIAQDLACRAARLSQGSDELLLLRTQRLVRGTGMKGEDLVVTYHDLIREAFCAHSSLKRRRRLHHRLAKVLEAWGRADAEWVAMHWECAGVKKRARQYYGLAADQAADLLAFDNAAELYQRALQMGPSTSGRRQLQRKLGDALANAGRGAEAAEVYLTAAEENAEESLELQRRAAEQYLRSGRIDKGLPVLEAVLERVGLRMPRRRWQDISRLLFHRGLLWLKGVTTFRERPLGDISPDEISRIDVCWTAAVGLSLVDPFFAYYFHARYLRLALRAGEVYRVFRGQARELGFAAISGGRARARVLERQKAVMELAQRINSPHALGLAHLWSGCAAWLVGEWQETCQRCQQAEQLFRDHGKDVAWELAWTRIFLFGARAWMGELNEHARQFPALLQEAHQRGDQFAITTLPVLTGAYHTTLAADNPDLARRQLQQAMQGWSSQAYHLQHFWALYGEVETDLYCGDAVQAWQTFQEQWPAIVSSMLWWIQTIRLFTLHLRARAALALAGSQHDRTTAPVDARLLRKQAVADISQMKRQGMAWANGLACLLQASLAFQEGNSADAQRFLGEAATALESAHMHLYAAAARRRLGQLLGGEQGQALIAAADSWITSQGIRSPARMTAVKAPGFADS
jgi:hypothetical protein